LLLFFWYFRFRLLENWTTPEVHLEMPGPKLEKAQHQAQLKWIDFALLLRVVNESTQKLWPAWKEEKGCIIHVTLAWGTHALFLDPDPDPSDSFWPHCLLRKHLRTCQLHHARVKGSHHCTLLFFFWYNTLCFHKQNLLVKPSEPLIMATIRGPHVGFGPRKVDIHDSSDSRVSQKNKGYEFIL